MFTEYIFFFEHNSFYTKKENSWNERINVYRSNLKSKTETNFCIADKDGATIKSFNDDCYKLLFHQIEMSLLRSFLISRQSKVLKTLSKLP